MEIEVRELTREQLEKLVKEVLENPERYNSEAKLILKIAEYHRQGDAFTSYSKIEILFGEAEFVKVSEIDAGYPYEKGEEYAVIPKTVPCVLLQEIYSDTSDPHEHAFVVHVFTGKEWKRVDIDLVD